MRAELYAIQANPPAVEAGRFTFGSGMPGSE